MALQVALALSGVDMELGPLDHWTTSDTPRSYHHGSGRLLKSSSASSLASSSGASSYYSTESGISSMSPDSISLEPIENLLSAIQFKIGKRDEEKSDGGSDTPSTVEERNDEVSARSVIMYGGRNVLDLGGLRDSWRPTFARLPEGVGSYFENRSQYSRLQGALPPDHTKNVCPDCGFMEPIHF